jgi:HSP20 family protein
MRTYDPLEAVQREFDGMLNRFFGSREMEGYLSPYAVDIHEDGDHIYVEAELPGFKREEIEITLENQSLTISAERQEDTRKREGRESLLRERRFTRFLRTFTLPPTVDSQKVDAKLAEGVLTITLDKREGSKPKKITVN